MLSVLYKDLLYIIADKLDFYDKQRLKHTSRYYYKLIKIEKIPRARHIKLNDKILKYYPHLTKLIAYNNPNITDEGIMGMPLTTLHAGNNPKITDAGIKGMQLTELYAYNNPNITDRGITGMLLTTLYAYKNPNITDRSIKGMPLTTLDVRNAPNITDAVITELKLKNPNIIIYR